MKIYKENHHLHKDMQSTLDINQLDNEDTISKVNGH